ncbi:unnamed protein product [Trifolium pratense]|uniref:Uncharacterized protein n=1 Tax=Trifolium pratense TaxID=57577 RepID=A0ACB0JUX6_TRIPR|nr:unnamed protein product [Trifolium pratense]
MRGSAHTWWLSWYPTDPKPSWDSFTCALLRHFKPEWRLILPGEEDAKEPTESEEVLEPLEEENQVKAEEKVKTESKKENNLSPIPQEIEVFTVSDLPSPKSPEPNPPETKSLENSFFIMLPPPLEPPDLQFPSEHFSAPPPATRPPSKPPDSSPSFLISRSHFRKPPCFSNSPLINSLPRPPENLSSLIPASPPPPPPAKPPDLIVPHWLQIFSRGFGTTGTINSLGDKLHYISK